MLLADLIGSSLGGLGSGEVEGRRALGRCKGWMFVRWLRVLHGCPVEAMTNSMKQAIFEKRRSETGQAAAANSGEAVGGADGEAAASGEAAAADAEAAAGPGADDEDPDHFDEAMEEEDREDDAAVSADGRLIEEAAENVD